MDYKKLIERYIYAVVKNLPHKGREDIERELETLIYDMLEERCKGLPPSEKDVRVVLAEIGTPEELENNYSPDKDKCLIGPPYYSKWKWLLKIILSAVLLGMILEIIISIIIQTVEHGMSTGEIFIEIVKWVGITTALMLEVSAALTIAVAIMQRKKISLDNITGTSWETVSVPKKEEKISKTSAICGIVFSIAAYILFFCVPQILCGVFRIDGEVIVLPVFSVEAIRSTWYFLAAFSVFGITREVFKYFEGRYTVRLAVVTGICDGLTWICTFLWMTMHKILNPAFFSYIGSVFAEEPIMKKFFENFQMFFLCVISFALVLDFGETLYKTLKYNRGFGNGKEADR